MEPYADLHDYSSVYGKFQLFLNKFNWKWTAVSVLTTTVLVLPFLFAGVDDSGVGVMQEGMIPGSSRLRNVLIASNNNNNNAEYLFDGPENTLTTFTGYNEIASKGQNGITVIVRNAYIDAPTFSKSLEGLTNLEVISLENVWLIGNFSRVFLPKLSKFTYQQNKDDKRDSYKSPASLKITLFFDKSENMTWDVEKELLNLGVVIQICKGGTKLIEVNRSVGEVYLNVKYCQNVLQNLQGGSISNLSLITCNVTEDVSTLIPATLKYLNMRNTIPSSKALEEIIKPQTELAEFYGYFNFHCDWPGYEVFLNISDLPLSTKKVGVNNMDMSSSSSDFKSSVTDLSIGDFISPQIVKDFDKIFTNVKQVKFFNISSQYAYPLLKNSLKTKAESIAFVMFDRVNVSDINSMDLNMMQVRETIVSIEKILIGLGIGVEESDFVIETKGKLRSGRILLESEKHSLRYTALGFDKMDTFQDYIMWDALRLSNKSDQITPTFIITTLFACVLCFMCSFVF